MGYPSTHGNPASSEAQQPEKSFPDATDPGGFAMVSGLPHDPVAAGSPVFPEIRQVTPIADMGMGYREAGEGDPF